MKRTILGVGALVFAGLALYLTADRSIPMTTDARVKAIITPLVAQVSGTIVEVPAANGTFVEPGAVLARIDPSDFMLARDQAAAELDQVIQDIGAGTAGVAAAQAEVARAASTLENARVQSDRVFQLERDGVASTAQGDTARTDLQGAQSALAAAEAELDRVQSQLGPEGAQNPQVRRASAALAQAELSLQRTEILAPARGGITDLVVAAGAFASAGKPVLTFVDIGQVWIEAYLTENNLGHVQVGDRAEIVLDMHPGRVLQGRVASISGTTADNTETTPGALTAAPRRSGWLREPQRIPVRISLPGYEVGNPEDDLRFMINGQADVIIYAGESGVMNMLGAGLIRLSSILSYAY
ncbi:MAG: HlyD family secretion protein [Dinoroseobacter sp.]|nr:HlyD family secretion protein [Dinoroseobacter sp.]